MPPPRRGARFELADGIKPGVVLVMRLDEQTERQRLERLVGCYVIVERVRDPDQAVVGAHRRTDPPGSAIR
jgi:hypothetical protein